MLITIVAGILMLGVLVFVHELGHFIVAKLAGVKVLKFSLGFGPALISRKVGETEYRISAIPLGGYVQMFGETGEAEDEEAAEEDRGRSFSEKPPSRRLAIVVAGPLMNLILPFLILPVAYMVGINLPVYLDQPACIGYVAPASPAAAAGLEAGDCIAAIGQKPVESWTKADKALLEQAGEPLVMTVVRADESRLQITLPEGDSSAEGLQSLGLNPEQEAIVGLIGVGTPAHEAGLEVGDRIVAIGSEPVESWYDLARFIQRGGGEPQVFQVLRDGQILDKVITPVSGETGDGKHFLIGVQPKNESSLQRYDFAEAVRNGKDRSVEMIKLTLVFIQKLLFGHVSTKNLGGPITVIQWAGQAAQADFSSLLVMLAFLSIQLGILNLLPIPILDGGHLLFNLIELIFRRPLSLRVREVAQQIGLVLLLMLMGLAFYNDIARLFFWGR
jgi:regulator of sigma E protease